MNQTNEMRRELAYNDKANEMPAGLVSGAAMEVEKEDNELNDELQVMRSTVRALQKLPYEGQRRVLAWLNDRLPPRLLGPNQAAGGSWNVPR